VRSRTYFGILALLLTACAARVEPASSPDHADGSRSDTSTTKNPAQIAEQAMPSVVSVVTETSLGSGFVVSPNGLVVTNLHVVAGRSEVLVVIGGEKLPVKRIYNGDIRRDLVVLEIETKGLRALPLGDSDRVRTGEQVVAIGNPLGLDHTVSNGLVSAVREVAPELTMLQISAPIAPGSSGGPLFNDRGEVIGVATGILVGGQNLNFGVPVNYLKPLLETPSPLSMEAFAESTAEPDDSPAVKRQIPKHALSVLDGCKPDSIGLMVESIHSAINVGAPLYNDGDYASCYHVYEGAALDIERKLGPSCKKATRALAAGRKKASTLRESHEQAWALRDAFDGLLDVVERWSEKND
jgi:serine protease Do